MRLCTGEYRLAQLWSRALWLHPACPHGILYRSRHDPSRFCAAMYDRAHGLVRTESRGRVLGADNLRLLGDILDTYGFGLIDV